MSLFFSSHSFLMVHIMQEVLLCQRKNIIIPKKEVAFALIWDIIKKGRAFALILDTIKVLCWVSLHREGNNPSSMEGVPDLRDHNSKYEIFKNTNVWNNMFLRSTRLTRVCDWDYSGHFWLCLDPDPDFICWRPELTQIKSYTQGTVTR